MEITLKLNADGSVTWHAPDEVPPVDPPVDPPPVDPPPVDPPPAATTGIWLNTAEIMARPMTGLAWERMAVDAKSSWGNADLSDNNSQHDVKTLAGALVAVRMGDDTMRGKTLDGLHSAMQSGLARALELSRGLGAYIVAADIIGYRDATFQAWVAKMIDAPVQGHSGTGIIGTATHSPNNWGGWSRFSLACAAVYLERKDWADIVVKAQKEMLGLPVSSPEFVYQDTNWHADPSNKAGINRKGATIQGKNVSGVLCEDWRRGGSFAWPPTKSGYMHEGLQGLVATAIVLHRAGLVPFSAGDDAIVRAFNMLYGKGEAAQNSPVFVYPAEGDDRGLPWAVNAYGGANFPTVPDEQPGKGMGYYEWALVA